MTNDTFSIRDLRDHAKRLRAQADEIDGLADHVERVLASLTVPEGVLDAVRKPHPAPRPTALEAPRTGGKGKAPGTLSMNWRGNFAGIADVAARDEFPLDLVRAVVRDRTGNDTKLSAIRRQFNTDYIKHGYVTSEAQDRYRLTEKLLALIGYQDGGEASHNENEASVADAADASETALAAQDGRPQE